MLEGAYLHLGNPPSGQDRSLTLRAIDVGQSVSLRGQEETQGSLNPYLQRNKQTHPPAQDNLVRLYGKEETQGSLNP